MRRCHSSWMKMATCQSIAVDGDVRHRGCRGVRSRRLDCIAELKISEDIL